MKHNRIAYALIVALAGSAALVGCKKKEEPVAATPPPAETAPAPAPAPVEPAPAPAPTATFTVGNTAAADKSVAAMTTFGPKDKIIVSVKTDASVPADAAVEAKLTFQDGQEAGKQTTNIKAENAGTTNVEFSNSKPWPVGKYKVDVTLNGTAVGTTQEVEVK